MLNIKKREDLDEGNFEFIRNSKNFLNFKKVSIKNIKDYTNNLIKT
jgi:hypothetical protein